MAAKPGTPGRVPVERGELETRDVGEVEDLISRRYVEHRPRMLGDTGRFVFRSQSGAAGGLTVDHSTYGATVAIRADPFRTILILGVIKGRFEVTAGRQHCSVAPGESVLYLPDVPLDVLMHRVTYQVAQFPAEVPTRLAGRLGIAPADFRFEAMDPVSPAMNRYWLSTSAHLMRTFAGPEPAVAHPLVLAGAIESAAAAALATFPNTTMTVAYTPGAGTVPPATVRRAIAYIDAHAGEPITLDEIATAAGIGVRGLQAGFARHRDTTPLGYLRRVRMERAHRDLQAGDRAQGDTVAAIARRWGFTSPGRFAVAYRDLYGRTPGRTLRT